MQTASQTGDASAGVAAAVEQLKSLAAGLGLDTATFNQCLDSDKNAQEVAKDLQDGLSYGVTGTPSFFVNGTPLVGAQPYATFQAAIDAALQKAQGG